MTLRNTQYCNYLRALGDLGLGEKEEAKELFNGILNLQKDHHGAISHLEF